VTRVPRVGREAAPQLPPNLIGLLDTLSGEPNVDPEFASSLRSVRDFLSADDPNSRPFLSVLLRTQGTRIEPFKDALLCLQAQTDQDFEVIVLAHDAEPSDAVRVRDATDNVAPALAARMTLLEVSGGTRSRPLNAGLAAARGHYVAVYDDDDLLFANWVEEFHRAAGKSRGRLLRATTANQKVRPETWRGGQSGFRAISWPAAEYPKAFEQLKHLVVNYSPFMTWAFPRSLFFTYGVRFDEELSVCEDWDVILRGSLLCGVDDVPALTSLYRRWEGGESSYTAHSVEKWRESEQRVIDRIDRSVYMMPPGSMRSSREMVVRDLALVRYRSLFRGDSLRWPLNLVWNGARPAARFARRVRNRLRRLRAR
jgi:hypothetical protein